ncbi:MAG: CorA family divalent cation transporter [Solirubrobacterales bacterium]
MTEWLRRVSVWGQDGTSQVVTLANLAEADGLRWFELTCGGEETGTVLKTIGRYCPGLSEPMLQDLLTPDERPEGAHYDGGIQLASSFSVIAWRPERQSERGKPQGVGVLRFQPVELLAGDSWLITCWHPERIFQGSRRRKDEDQPPGDADDLFEAVVARWKRCPGQLPGDLGISVMHELALTYAPTHRALHAWLEDWELSLYIEDDLNNHDQLPELWGLMAVLRDWLNPLNKAGLRADLGKAWLPVSNHEAAIEVDDRIDKALAALGRLSDKLRQSFGLLHLEQSEEQRQQSERTQHRVELIAAIFLLPTFIVGFYGANTWVPGQGRHWGFYVMVAALVVMGSLAVGYVLRTHRRTEVAQKAAKEERKRMRDQLLRATR